MESIKAVLKRFSKLKGHLNLRERKETKETIERYFKDRDIDLEVTGMEYEDELDSPVIRMKIIGE